MSTLKVCGCGASYDLAQWNELRECRVFRLDPDDADSVHEQRTCSACRSSLLVPIVDGRPHAVDRDGNLVPPRTGLVFVASLLSFALTACGGTAGQTLADADGLDAVVVEADAGPEAAKCVVPPVADAGVVAIEGLVYATPNGAPLALDIVRPADVTHPRPLVVFIHGGGWYAGFRSLEAPYQYTLAGLGYVTASIDYRLICPPSDAGVHAQPGCGPENRYPVPVDDARAAVAWLKAHAADYGIDATRVAAVGGSAGGYIAAMLGTDPDVAATAAFYSPLDLDGPFYEDNIWRFLGDASATAASPSDRVSRSTPPMLLVHGTADTTMPYAQSTLMLEAMADAGAHATLVPVPDAGHGFPLLSAEWPVSSCALLTFLAKELHP